MTVQQEVFIIEYLKKGHSNIDACNSQFHDTFYKKFGGSTRITINGTKCVNKAMLKLHQMWEDGKLDRCSIIYDCKIDKKPSWGYSYWLS